MAIIIAGFPSTDLVPGPYGEVKYGAGATSAASIPLKLLCVGMKASNASGTSTADASVDRVSDVLAADSNYGVGGQVTRMSQAALQIQGVDVWCAPVAVPNGATQATLVLTISAATQTRNGTMFLRLAGITISVSIGITDTTTVIATNVAAAINAVARLPMTAQANSGVVTITVVTPGAQGTQYVGYLDTSSCQGVTATITGLAWVASTPYTVGTFGVPTVGNGFYYKVTAVSGSHTSGSVEPTWPTTLGTTVVDNTGANQITWTCWGQVLTGGLATFANGGGVEDVTNVLAIIKPQQFDRIAVAQNDATNLGRWRTQIDTQAGPLTLLLQHAICASNSTLAAATSLAQTTLNDQRFQLLWQLNGETHPSEVCSVFGAIRTAAEATDPDASYDGQALPNVAPQSQRQDWPSHSTKVSALNNGVTPIETSPSQTAVIVRSITTHSLNGSTPDYSTLDTSSAVVPDFALRDLLLYWKTAFLPSNPRVAPEPLANQKAYKTGVGYPSLWNSYATARLRKMEAGDLGGTQVPPILVDVDNNLPVSVYDDTAGRIMSAVTVKPAKNQHQIGVSVRQG